MAERRILNSWKEIASHLGRGVRTVQRWEAQLGLPVHRPAGKEHSAVMAFSSELDQWLDRRPMRTSFNSEGQREFNGVAAQSLLAKAEILLERCEALLQRNDELNRKLSAIAENLHAKEDMGKSAPRHIEAGAA